MRSIWIPDVTATPSPLIKTVSHVLTFQTESGYFCLGVAANFAVPSGAVAGISKFPSKENAKGADRNMWDRWTLPCCALTTRDDKGNFRKLDWKRSFGVLRSAMLRFWKRLLLRGFFRYKFKTEGESGRELPTYVREDRK
jgi:hypothetical protein